MMLCGVVPVLADEHCPFDASFLDDCRYGICAKEELNSVQERTKNEALNPTLDPTPRMRFGNYGQGPVKEAKSRCEGYDVRS